MDKPKPALIFLNGEKPSKTLCERFIKEPSFLICADGAANYLADYLITPDLIIGDFDSILPATEKTFQECLKIKDTSQNTTDFEKTLNYCVLKGHNPISVLGGAGGRLDHGLSNLSAIYPCFLNKLDIRLVTDREEIFCADKPLRINSYKGALISLMPLFGKVHIEYTQGLSYPIVNQTLEMGRFISISNQLDADDCEIGVVSGTLLIILRRKD
ncbi:MAG: thiamine diphosphokinase [Deltaproteobacteria bacterium]|nr:thiamine diphosphokinase [Deltaproteobacteria bacterium]